MDCDPESTGCKHERVAEDLPAGNEVCAGAGCIADSSSERFSALLCGHEIYRAGKSPLALLSSQTSRFFHFA
jgi:hypothetical protein